MDHLYSIIILRIMEGHYLHAEHPGCPGGKLQFHYGESVPFIRVFPNELYFNRFAFLQHIRVEKLNMVAAVFE